MLTRCRQSFGPLLLSISILGLAAPGCGPVDADDDLRRRPPIDNGGNNNGGNNDGGNNDGGNNDGGNNNGGNNDGGNNDGGNNDGGNNDGGNNDGGNNDGGNNDGGNNDGGNTATVVGDSCELGTQANPEGSCDEGQYCVDLDDTNNACSVLGCSSDLECGKNGEAQNLCLTVGEQGGQGIKGCLRSCDPETANSCGRDGFKCFTFFDGNLCLPDCRAPGNGCGQGESCDPTGQCRASGSLENYDRCGRTVQDTCAISDICVGFGPGSPSVCLTACTQLGQQDTCPNGSICGAGLDSETSLCLKTCDVNADDCPWGSTCEDAGPSGLCIPD